MTTPDNSSEADTPAPMKTYLFFRATCFYPIELRDDSDVAEHVRLNPGTLKVEDALTQRVVWPAQPDAPQEVPDATFDTRKEGAPGEILGSRVKASGVSPISAPSKETIAKDYQIPNDLWVRFGKGRSIIAQWDFEPFPPDTDLAKDVVQYSRAIDRAGEAKATPVASAIAERAWAESFTPPATVDAGTRKDGSLSAAMKSIKDAANEMGSSDTPEGYDDLEDTKIADACFHHGIDCMATAVLNWEYDQQSALTAQRDSLAEQLEEAKRLIAAREEYIRDTDGAVGRAVDAQLAAEDELHLNYGAIAEVTSLRSALAEKEKELESCKKDRSDWAGANHRQIGVIQEQRARLATLEADKRRLDWLDHQTYQRMDEIRRLLPITGFADSLIRAAIDSLSANPRLLSEGPAQST